MTLLMTANTFGQQLRIDINVRTYLVSRKTSSSTAKNDCQFVKDPRLGFER